MTIVEIGKKVYTVPQKWEELSGQQLAAILPILLSEMPEDVARLHLIKHAVNATWWKLWWAGVGELEDKLYLVDWMFQENNLTKNIIPQYRGFHGPKSSFDNLLISEFIFTEQFYGAYRSTEVRQEQEAALNKLVAVLYRPAKKNYDINRNADGDTREKFNDNLIDYYSEQVSAWPFDIKRAIAFWYQGCRAELMNDFPKVFGGGGGGESVYGLWDILFNIAEKNVLGDFAKVESALLKTVLMVLTKTIADAERLEQLSKSKT